MPWWFYVLWTVFLTAFSVWVGGAMASGDLMWWRKQ